MLSQPLKPEQARSGYNSMIESRIASASWTQEDRSSAISVSADDGRRLALRHQ
jgi:hypothetical protein